MEYKKIKSFTDLNAWKEGHNLVLQVYKLTKTFPSEEKLVLTSQIRRSVISVTSNIAEGFSRSSQKDKAKFYYTSLASLTEMQNQILVAKDLGYISLSEFKETAEQSVTVGKLISGLIKSAKSK